MRVDRGRLRGSMDSSFHLEEAAQAQCRLAADAGHGGSGHARQSGAADASDNQHERRELAHVPLWPVAAVVGSVLRGIRTINATASACKRLGNCVSGEWWQSCQRGHLRAAGVGHAAAEVSNWASDHAPAVFQVSTREVWRWSASPGAGERSALAQIICYPRTTPV